MQKTIAMAVLFAVSIFGIQRHHALNGTWTLVPAKSDFAGQPAFQTGTVTINDREANITIARNFTYDGADDTYSYSFSTDGQENATIRHGKDFTSKSRWEGDTLKVTTTQAGATTVERYSLAADGTLTLKVELPNHGPITLQFVKK